MGRDVFEETDFSLKRGRISRRRPCRSRSLLRELSWFGEFPGRWDLLMEYDLEGKDNDLPSSEITPSMGTEERLRVSSVVPDDSDPGPNLVV